VNKRARHVWSILRQGPTEAGYAFFRARRRRRNLADAEPELSESDLLGLRLASRIERAELEANAALLEAQAARGATPISSIQWFVPWFHLVTGGGIHTLLRFADHLAREHGVESRFCVHDRDTPALAADVSRKIAGAFPGLASAPVLPAGASLPAADAAIATDWPGVFSLLRFRDAPARFFFVQDWEPDFYPAGSASALLEAVGDLGLPGIVNTPGLADAYRARGNPAVSFTPCVDTTRYHPPAKRPDNPVRVFFYGRPATPRNAFGLGLDVLRRVKERHGSAVDIVCAGEDWSPGQYGVADVLRNEGMLEDADAVADLYRRCDIGLVFMMTRHPSYQPFEFMASGMAAASNENPYTAWFLRHEHNCLLAPAVPALLAEQVSRLVDDAPLRARIAEAGRAEVSGRRWEDEIEGVWKTMTGRGIREWTA
jgi:O-antigen biosynthesis protein